MEQPFPPPSLPLLWHRLALHGGIKWMVLLLAETFSDKTIAFLHDVVTTDMRTKFITLTDDPIVSEFYLCCLD